MFLGGQFMPTAGSSRSHGSTAATSRRFDQLQQPANKCLLEYVWIDDDQKSFRSRTVTVDTVPGNVQDLRTLHYRNPSSKATEEICVKPAALFNDPMRGGNSRMVLCDTYDLEGNATASNKRASCLATMTEFEEDEPWFGMDQEFALIDIEGQRCIGWPRNGLPNADDSYYCGIGANNVSGRDVVEAHQAACCYAGINYWSLNAEPLPGLWEFQIGVCHGIEMGDHLMMARYLMCRVADEFGCRASFDPMPLPHAKDLMPRPRCCTNFSTLGMRTTGIKIIEAAITRLSAAHNEFIEFEQTSDSVVMRKRDANKRPLHTNLLPPPSRSNPLSVAAAVVSRTEQHLGVPPPKQQQLAEPTDEHSGTARHLSNREKFFRIPAHIILDGKGYMQDRRPESDSDPYVVSECLTRTVCNIRRRISGPLMFNRGFRSLDGQHRGSADGQPGGERKPSPFQTPDFKLVKRTTSQLRPNNSPIPIG